MIREKLNAEAPIQNVKAFKFVLTTLITNECEPNTNKNQVLLYTNIFMIIKLNISTSKIILFIA